MDPREITGALASGGSFRATPALLEIVTPTGEIAAAFDTRTFSTINRTGQTVTITRQGNSDINVTAASLEEAQELEGALRPTPAASTVPAADQPAEDTRFNNLLKWGCLATLSIVGILAICLILALIFTADDDDFDATSGAAIPVVTSTPVGAAAATVQPTSSSNMPAVTVTAASDAVPTATPRPEPGLPGSSRDNPAPFGETVQNGDWELQVLEVVRGSEAFDNLLETNQYNDPPPVGHEYVLVNLRARYLGDSEDAQDVGSFWLRATGDARVKHRYTFAVNPSPEFQASLFTGGEVSGWASVLVREDEGNLLLIFQPWLSWDDDDELFLALERGASVEPVSARLAEEDDLGRSRSVPVPLGERAVGETWELWIIETIRGDEALELVLEANEFNDEPEEGMEYLLVNIGARNVASGDEAEQINSLLFRVTGDAAIIYDSPYAVEPEPRMDYDVYPGGEVTGWVTLQIPTTERDLILVYEPWFSFTDKKRYFALE
jgi:hypothetical protein